MKSTLSFRFGRRRHYLHLSNRQATLDAMNGTKYREMIYELDQHLRGLCKYSNNEAACNIRQWLHDELLENNIPIE